MIQLRKFPIWRLQSGFVTTWPIIWYSDTPATGNALWHEEIHAKQQLQWLLIPYFLIYLFALPVFFNPFRYFMEWYCYRTANGYSPFVIKQILSKGLYGWMPYWLNGWVIPKGWR